MGAETEEEGELHWWKHREEGGQTVSDRCSETQQLCVQHHTEHNNMQTHYVLNRYRCVQISAVTPLSSQREESIFQNQSSWLPVHKRPGAFPHENMDGRMFVWKSLKSTSSWLNSPDKEMEQWAGTATLLSNTDQRDGTFHNGNTTERKKWWGGMCSLSAAVMSSVFVSMTSVSVSDSEFQFRLKSTAAPSWRCRGNMDNRPVTVTTRVTGRYHKMAHQRRRYCCPCCFWTPGAVTAQLDLHGTDCSCVKCLQKMHAAAVIRT